ncbi:MAG: FecR domain-containing protein, partial [Oceanospirillales bacterium]|nr:FecR domain-containing protein [Oceanospirillales bacterium]
MRALLVAVLLILPFPVWAAAQVGLVLLAIGQVEAVDAQGEARALQRKSPLYDGDLLRTGEGGRLQVRFTDGGLVSVKPASEFRIAEYSFDKDDREKDNAVFELLKGGMRTVTGQVGKHDKDDYSVRTVVATIGIRGTHYELQLCDVSCAGQRNAPPGLVGRVLDGRIHVSGQSDAKDIPKGQYFSLSQTGGSSIVLSDEPPAGFVEDTDDPAGGTPSPSSEGGEDTSSSDAGSKGSEPGDGSVTGSDDVLDPQLSNALDTQVIDSTAAGSLTNNAAGFVGNAPSGSVVLVSMTEQNSSGGYKPSSGYVKADGANQIQLSTIGAVGNVPTKIYYLGDAAGDCQPCTFDSGTAVLTDIGGDAIGVNWGRWSGGLSLSENGVAVSSSNFDYIYSDKITPLSVVAAQTGLLTYYYVGGTAPVTENGLTAAYTSGSISIDFSNDSVTGAVLSMSGFADFRSINLSLDAAQSLTSVVGGDALLISGSCAGGGPCSSYPIMTGEMNMTFVGSNADAIISTFSASGNNGSSD